jgi:hypothetical protein
VVTETGLAVLGAYRSMVAATDRVCAGDIATVMALLSDVSDRK